MTDREILGPWLRRFFVEHHPNHAPEELPSGPMALLH